MLEKLEADFSSNNLIFIGCSLLDELDMLFVSGTRFSQKKKENKDIKLEAATVSPRITIKP